MGTTASGRVGTCEQVTLGGRYELKGRQKDFPQFMRVVDEACIKFLTDKNNLEGVSIRPHVLGDV